MLEILDINPGGSGQGPSFYSEPCARRSQLFAQLKEEGRKPNPSPKTQMMVGTFAHQFVEWFHNKQKVDTTLVQVSDIAYEDDRLNAIAVFEAYKQRCPDPEFWGKVIATEMQLPPEGLEDPLMADIIEYFGVPITGKLDMVVEVSAENVTQLEALGIVSLPGPGLYNWDLKTKDRADKNMAQKQAERQQYVAYLELYKLVTDIELRGTIVVSPIKRITKGEWDAKRMAEDMEFYFVPAPDATQVSQLKQWLGWKAQYLASGLPNKDETSCFAYHKPCPFLDGSGGKYAGACKDGLPAKGEE